MSNTKAASWGEDFLRRASATRRGSELQAPPELDVVIDGSRRAAGDAVVVRQALNMPDELELLVVLPSLDRAPDDVWLAEQLLGRRVEVSIRQHSVEATHVAVIVSATRLGYDAARGSAYLHVEAQSDVALAASSSRSRVFADTTLREIVEQVVSHYRIKTRWALLEEPLARRLAIQYQESDLSFVARLLAEAGIYWYVAPGTSDTIVLGEREAGLGTESPAGASFTLATDDRSDFLSGHFLRAVRMRQNLRPNRASTLAHDPYRANACPPGTNWMEAFADATAVEHLQHGVSFATATAPTTTANVDIEHYRHDRGRYASAKNAERLLQHLRSDSAMLFAEGVVPGLFPGLRLQLAFADDSLERRVVVRQAVHTFIPKDLGGTGDYRCALTMCPLGASLAAAYLPEPVANRIETGTVVGEPGRVIHTNELGEVKVQLHWDRHGLNDQNSSCWMRVAQVWSGPGYGFQFIPRVGTEVIVGFAGGNIDHPIVIGSLHNVGSPLPESPATRPARSAIRSQSLGGTGFNELVFDDAPGDQRVELNAEQDVSLRATRHHQVAVGADSTVHIGGDAHTSIAGGQRIDVGDAARHQFGRWTVDVEGDTSHHLMGDQVQRVRGAQISDIGGGKLETVTGFARLGVVPADEDEPGDLELVAAGRIRLAARELDLTGVETISLRVGATSIEITEGRVFIGSTRVSTNATEEVEVFIDKSEAMRISDSFSVSRGGVVLSSGGASLRLDADAHLDGGLVKLNCGPTAGGAAGFADDGSEAAVATFRIELPVGVDTATFSVQHPDGTLVDHQAPDGVLTLEGPQGARFVLQRVVIDGVTYAVHDVETRAR